MDLKLFLLLGTFLMMAVMLFANRWMHLPVWKILTASVILTLAGVAGARIMARIEMGVWGGISYYGAVFFAPLLMIGVSFLLRVRPSQMLDLCAPSECVMLALLKVNCYLNGCCFGKVIGISKEGDIIRFPSQIVESVTALLLMAVLLSLIRGGKQNGRIYCWYLLLYGAVRFVLNLMRETEPFLLGMPAGNFWSLVSNAAGGILLALKRYKGKSIGNLTGKGEPAR